MMLMGHKIHMFFDALKGFYHIKKPGNMKKELFKKSLNGATCDKCKIDYNYRLVLKRSLSEM